jgi:hypothetical protein
MDQGRAQFEQIVIQSLPEMEVELALQERMGVLPSRENQVGSPQADSLKAAAAILKERKVLDIICPGLRGVSNDLTSLAKWLTPGLFPLAIAGTIPMNPLIFAGVAVLIVHFGINIICPDAIKATLDKPAD